MSSEYQEDSAAYSESAKGIENRAQGFRAIRSGVGADAPANTAEEDEGGVMLSREELAQAKRALKDDERGPDSFGYQMAELSIALNEVVWAFVDFGLEAWKVLKGNK